MRSGCSCSAWLQTARPGNGHHPSVCRSQYVHMHPHCCMWVCVVYMNATHTSFLFFNHSKQLDRGGGSGGEVSRDEEEGGEGGNYFWIKGPVDLFLFSAPPSQSSTFTLCLSFFLPIHLYRPQSFPKFCTCSLLACFSLTFPPVEIPLCPHVSSAFSSSPPSSFLYLFFFR